MFKHGTLPTVLDKRDYSFHRSFGTVTPQILPADFNVDVGLTMPDQNADGLYFGCTGYTQADNATDVDHQIYNPRFTYEKTCIMEGHEPITGCQIRNSIKSTRIYGLQKGDESDQAALSHRRGNYFNVYDDGGMDWFDSIKSSIFINKRGLSIGTPFFNEWRYPGTTGILSSQVAYDGVADHYQWHNWAIKGWKTIEGKEYLVAKMWAGNHYGNGGWVYFSRELINQVIEIRGSAIFTVGSFDPKETKSIQLDIWEQILHFLFNLVGKQRLA